MMMVKRMIEHGQVIAEFDSLSLQFAIQNLYNKMVPNKTIKFREGEK